MNLPLVLFGAGGHGRVVLDIAFAAKVSVDYLVDENSTLSSLFGVAIARPTDTFWKTLGCFRFIAAVGDNRIRERVFRQLQQLGGTAVNLMHPFSSVSSRAKIGIGVVVCPGVVVNAGTVLEDNCIVNTSASVDHDCYIGAHSHIGPGARLAGNVVIGQRGLVGAGSILIPGISVGEDSIIGAGSVVVAPVPDRVVAFGVPAKVRRSSSTQSAS